MELACKVSLKVENLNYCPVFGDFEKLWISALDAAGIRHSLNEYSKTLHSVSFIAVAGKITGIIGGEQATRRSLVDLIRFVPVKTFSDRDKNSNNCILANS